jgi:tripartite-type tricarboxylate transporter receptor subunit TctC
MNRNRLSLLLLVVGFLLNGATRTKIFAADFYRGKTMRINVGSPPGGGYDTYARLIARHLPKHIPGKPKIIVENMPGASGLIAANYVFNVSKPNGLTIAHINYSIPQMEFLGNSAVKYRSLEFEWLGLANSSVITVAIGKHAPVQTVEDWIKPGTPPLIFACNTRTGLTCSTATALNDIFGPISQVVPGYAGTATMRAAIMRKEADALTGWTWDSVKATGLPQIDKGDLKLLAYLGDERNSELDERKVTYLNDFVRKPEDKAFLKILTMPAATVRPWAAVPGTPKDRVKILRDAFTATLKDPVLLKEAERLKVEIAPKSAEWVIDYLRKTKAELKPAVIERARQIIGLN